MHRKFIFLIGFLFFFLLGPAVLAAGNGDIFIAPAQQNDLKDMRTKSWFIYDFAAGTVHQDRVLIKNESDSVRTLVLYPVDAYLTEQGGFALRKSTDEKKDIGSWITLEKNQITLLPGKTEEVTFSYLVPSNADPGEHAGGIVAEDTAVLKGKGIQVVKRVGVRLYHTIPGEKKQPSSDLGLFQEKNIGQLRSAAQKQTLFHWPFIFLSVFSLILIIAILTFPSHHKKHKKYSLL